MMILCTAQCWWLLPITAEVGWLGTLAEVTALVVFAGLITVFVEYGIPFLNQ